jgi:hypothetical protein
MILFLKHYQLRNQNLIKEGKRKKVKQILHLTLVVFMNVNACLIVDVELLLYIYIKMEISSRMKTAISLNITKLYSE